MRGVIKLGTVTMVLAANLGCLSTVTGNEGNFRFSYLADDRVFDFNKPIAVGASLDIEVTTVGDGASVTIASASVEDPSILDAVGWTGNRVTVKGMGSGSSLLNVEGAAADGDAQTDSINLLSRVPEVHHMRHTCAPRDAAAGAYAYITGQRVFVGFDLEMDNGQPVIGYAYYPVATAGGATLDASYDSGVYMAIELGSAGIATLTSEIDGGAFEMAIIEESQIDGAEQPIAFVLEDVDVGDVNPFYVLPSSEGRPVCQAVVSFEVQSDTPEICDVRAIAPRATETSDQGKELGWFEMEGIREGECLYTVRYPNGAGGAGASTQFSFTIQP